MHAFILQVTRCRKHVAHWSFVQQKVEELVLGASVSFVPVSQLSISIVKRSWSSVKGKRLKRRSDPLGLSEGLGDEAR